jgi:Ca2+:H+ antiporter
MTRRDVIELGLAVMLVGITAACNFGGAPHVVTFIVAAITLAILARQVGTATEQLGARLGSGAAGVVQSALGNLPELFIALFALHAGLFSVVQSALVGSVLANSVLVLGIAFTVGGIKHGTQRFDSDRARMISTLALVAAATMAIPSLAHEFHTPAAPHGQALSLICAAVLLVIFLLTLPSFLRSTGDETHEPARWSPAVTAVVLGLAGLAAAFTADWFISALTPALHTLHMSQDFAGLVVVAIAGNAVENVVGVQLAARNRPDFAISVIMNSSLQVSLGLTPLLVFVSLLFATHLTLVFPTLLALTLVISSILGAFVVNDGRSTWQEGAVLVGFYVVIASSFWWGT